MYDVVNCILADRIWCTFFITTNPSLSRISVLITLFTITLFIIMLCIYMCYLIVEEMITNTKFTIFTKSPAILFSDGRVWCQDSLKLFVHLWPHRIVWRPIQGHVLGRFALCIGILIRNLKSFGTTPRSQTWDHFVRIVNSALCFLKIDSTRKNLTETNVRLYCGLTLIPAWIST